MRVRFGELSRAEAEARERLSLRAGEAWECLRQGDERRAERLMNAIDARVTLSVTPVTPADASAVLLATLTSSEACAWPLAELLLTSAPDDVPCALSLGRPALSLERALDEARTQYGVELERATFRAGFSRGHLLEITLSVPGGSGSEIEQNAAENLVSALLGDRVFETWVGAVHVTSAPRGGPLRVLDTTAPRAPLHLHELFATVSAATLGVLQGLPELPRAVTQPSLVASSASVGVANDEREEWTLLEVEPLDAARGDRKDDLVLASSCTPELLRCYLDGSPCASRRFSRAGEQFVFVSYADDEPTLERRLTKRGALEAALSESIGTVGAVTGVGLGVKTTYLDLALCNLETGLARLVSKLRDVGAPPRTFIQFFDSELADEWLAIWPDIRISEE